MQACSTRRQSSELLVALQASDEGRHAKAVQLMERCARNGEPVACYFMALWCRDGEVLPADPDQSKFWLSELQRLAEEGNPEAQWELGQSLRFGNLFLTDIPRANHWLERSAESGWGEAQHHLACYLEAGLYGYKVDPVASETWYQRAFDQHHPETLYNLAWREFDNGKITERARALLEEAAEKGFKQAEQILCDYSPPRRS